MSQDFEILPEILIPIPATYIIVSSYKPSYKPAHKKVHKKTDKKKQLCTSPEFEMKIQKGFRNLTEYFVIINFFIIKQHPIQAAANE